MNAGIKILAMVLFSAFYWHFVCWLTGAMEPWDAETYWGIWYPASFGLSALAALFFKKLGWLAGVIMTFAQLPVMWLNTGTGPLWAVGLIMLCLLAVPVSIVSAITGWIAAHPRSV